MGEREEILFINTPEEVKELLAKTRINFDTPSNRFYISLSQSAIEYLLTLDYNQRQGFHNYKTLQKSAMPVEITVRTSLLEQSLFSQLITMTSLEDCITIFNQYKEQNDVQAMIQFLKYGKITEDMLNTLTGDRKINSYLDYLLSNPTVHLPEYENVLDKIVDIVLSQSKFSYHSNYYFYEGFGRHGRCEYLAKNWSRLSSLFTMREVIASMNDRYVSDDILEILLNESAQNNYHATIACTLTKEQARKYGYALWKKSYTIYYAEGPFFTPDEDMDKEPPKHYARHGHSPLDQLMKCFKSKVYMSNMALDSLVFAPINFILDNLDAIIDCTGADTFTAICTILYENNQIEALKRMKRGYYFRVFCQENLSSDYPLFDHFDFSNYRSLLFDFIISSKAKKPSTTKNISSLVEEIIRGRL